MSDTLTAAAPLAVVVTRYYDGRTYSHADYSLTMPRTDASALVRHLRADYRAHPGASDYRVTYSVEAVQCWNCTAAATAVTDSGDYCAEHAPTATEPATESAPAEQSFTLDTLPASGVLRIYATASVVTAESAEQGDAAEQGWTDGLSGSAVWDNRDDVSPAAEYTISGGLMADSVADVHDLESHGVARGEIEQLISALGADDSDCGSTLYAADGVIWDYTTGETFLYALHAHVKHYTAAGWIESPVNILD